jgi:hypothetical protein
MAQLSTVLSHAGHDLHINTSTTPVSPISADAVKDPSQEDSHALAFMHQYSRLDYNDRVKLQYRVSDLYKTHFILIKGLIEFYRPKESVFLFDARTHALEVSVDVAAYHRLEAFLQLVERWLLAEIEFKATLKRILQFENHYRAESVRMYDPLMR